MTTKTLSAVYQNAYVLSSPITTLSLTASGYVAQGISASATGTYTVVNHGVIANTNTVSGDYSGLFLGGAAVVTNSGVIKSSSTTSGVGVVIGGGGTLTNQAGGTITAYIGAEIAGGSGTVVNGGQIVGSGKYGVALVEGGTITNGGAGDGQATIRGAIAIVTAATTATVRNYGTVVGTGTTGVAVYLHAGGLVTNGSASDTTALMTGAGAGVGFGSAAGTLNNFGAVRSTGTAGAAVILSDGGVVTNGSATDTTALVSGNIIGIGAVSQAATVQNFGDIVGGYQSTGLIAGGLYLEMGGSVTNGSSTDTKAFIGGAVGVAVKGATGTVANFGTIGGASTEIGLLLANGGTVTNGSTSDTSALIQGYIGVAFETISSVFNNFGTVIAGGAVASLGSILPGVFMAVNGVVNNGSAADTIASIGGGIVGVYTSSTAVGTVNNFGTIGGSTAAVDLDDGGKVINGSATDTGAKMIGGRIGAAILNAVGTLVNFGAIRGGESTQSIGAAVAGGGLFTNGSTSDHTASITGWVGAFATGATKLTNYGVIQGDAGTGTGVQLGAGASLTNEAGALIEGSTGVTVGAGATASNFGTLIGNADKGVVMTDATSRLNLEAGSVCYGQVVTAAGLVDVVSGTAQVSGVNSNGVIEGAGILDLNNGSSAFAAGTKLLVAEIAVTGGGEVAVVANISDTKVWNMSNGVIDVGASSQMTFAGNGNAFTGAINGAGAVLFNGGSDTFDNLSFGIAHATIKNATVTLADTVTFTGIISDTSPHVIVAAGGATLTGGGILSLSNLTSNWIIGATATATLTNDDTIRGGGELGAGKMSLINAGTIEAVGTAALNVSTGTNTVINSGLIEAFGTGHFLTLESAVNNTGTLVSDGGALTLDGDVTGAGTVKVDGGSVTALGAFSENVAFGPSGRLGLFHSQTFTGTVSGFSKTGTTSFDLHDIALATATASYSGTTSSGVLTVTDGTHTAHIHLIGNYTASSWTLSNDGGGGTVVVDPTKPAAQVLALASASASFGAGGGAATAFTGGAQVNPTLLISPHAGAA